MMLLVKGFKAFEAVRRRACALFSTLCTRILFRLNGIRPNGLRANGVPVLHVSLGGRCTIGRNFLIRTGVANTDIGHGHTRIRIGRGGHLVIGDRVGLSNCSIWCENSITIGDSVFVGGGVQIFDTNFHSTNPAERCAVPEIRTNIRTAPVTIGNRAFIGLDAIICKGVTIGAEAIVAAGSVVTTDIPAGEVWGGNPAVRIG